MINLIVVIIVLLFLFWCIECSYNNGTIDGYNACKFSNDNLHTYVKIRKRMNNENT